MDRDVHAARNIQTYTQKTMEVSFSVRLASPSERNGVDGHRTLVFDLLCSDLL
jgi:hypothetical protein